MLRTAAIVVACAAVLRRLQRISIASTKRKANQGRTVSSPDETGAQTFVLNTSKKVELYCRRWGSLMNPKAAVILLHSELLNGSYFKLFAEKLNEKGFVCYSVDLTGFGKSGCQQGMQSHISAYTDYLGDLDAIVEVAIRETGGLPIALYGEGLGATCALAYMLNQTNKEKVSAMVVTSPTLEPPIAPGRVEGGVYGILGKLSTTACGPRENPDYDIAELFVDEEVGLAARTNFEELQPASVKKIKEVGALCDYVNSNIAQLTVPMLVLHGSPDQRNDIKRSENLKESAGSAMKYFRSYRDAGHGILYGHPATTDSIQNDVSNFIMRALASKT